MLTIAKRMAASSKTFYQLYASKEDLFLDAYQAVGVVVRESGLNVPNGGALRIEPGEIADYAARILAVIAAAFAAVGGSSSAAGGAAGAHPPQRSHPRIRRAARPPCATCAAELIPPLPPLTDEVTWSWRWPVPS